MYVSRADTAETCRRPREVRLMGTEMVGKGSQRVCFSSASNLFIIHDYYINRSLRQPIETYSWPKMNMIS